MIGEFLVRLGIVGERDVENAARRSGRALHDAGAEAEHAGTRFARAANSFERFVSTASHGANVFGAVNDAFGAARGFISDLIGPAVGFEALNNRLESVVGSAEDAARILKFVDQVAAPSNLTSKQLSEASVMLEAFGVKAERNLPTLARLAMAFNLGQEQIDMFARGLGDLATGKFPEADVLAAVGLNRDMFREKGIKFDNSGQLLSSAEETFAALEMIVNERYGNIFDKMKDTYSAKLSSLEDVTERFKRIIGEGVLSVAAPWIDQLSGVMQAVEASGVLRDTVSQAGAGLSNLLGAGADQNTVVTLVSGLLSIVSQLPDAIGKVGGAISHAFQVTKNNALVGINMMLVGIGEIMTFASNQGTLVIDALVSLSEGRIADARSLLQDMKSQAAIDRLSSAAMIAGASVGMQEYNFKPYEFDLLKNQKAFADRIGAVPAASMNVPEGRGDFLARRSSKVEEALDEIATETAATARHTGKMAEPLSMRRQITGGGDNMQIGATRAELFGGGGEYIRNGYGLIRVVIEGDGPLAKLIRENSRIEIGTASGAPPALRY